MQTSHRFSALAFSSASLCALLVGACSVESVPPSQDGLSGAGGSSPSSGGTGAATGGVVEGSGGSATGGAGTGGASKVGIQTDPGTDGDGTFDHPGPYLEPPEASGAYQGTLVGADGTLRFQSSVYAGREFPYWIYVPPQYDPAKPAALMVFQDGICYIDCDVGFFYVPQVFDTLIAEGAMPVTIGLFINPPRLLGADDHVDADRAAAYDSLSAKYSTFLIDEIIPSVVQSAYNIVEDPDGWAVGGHSSGGICAFTVGWNRPDKFHKILTHNGSFVDIAINKSGEEIGGWSYPDLIAAEPTPKPLRTVLLSGPGDIDNEHGSWLEGNDRVAAALADEGYHYRYQRGTMVEGTQHWPPLQASSDLPDALRWLFRGYSIP